MGIRKFPSYIDSVLIWNCLAVVQSVYSRIISINQEYLRYVETAIACKELFTLKLGLPRRCGNTLLAACLYLLYNSVCLVPYSKMGKTVIDNINVMSELNDIKPRVVEHCIKLQHNNEELVNFIYDVRLCSAVCPDPYENINVMPLNNGDYDKNLVIIDNAFVLSKAKMNTIYERFGVNKLYVILGN